MLIFMFLCPPTYSGVPASLDCGQEQSETCVDAHLTRKHGQLAFGQHKLNVVSIIWVAMFKIFSREIGRKWPSDFQSVPTRGLRLKILVMPPVIVLVDMIEEPRPSSEYKKQGPSCQTFLSVFWRGTCDTATGKLELKI
jgi:hypothetical protein